MLKYLQKRTGITGEMAAVLAVMGLTTLAMSLLNPVLPLYLTSIDIGPALLGTMLSVAMFGMAIGESLWGLAADRIGIRPPMLTGTFICAASVSLFLLTQNIAAFSLPYGTLVSNLGGCLVIGLIAGFSGKTELLSTELRLLLATGFCGGFTTMSSFVYELASLARAGDIAIASLYFSVTLIGSIAFFYVGTMLVQLLRA